MVLRAEHSQKPTLRSRLGRLLGVIVVLGVVGYLLFFARNAPFGHVGKSVSDSLADVTAPLLLPDAAGTPDEIQARWNAEFGEGDASFETAGPTASMLFRSNLRGLRAHSARGDAEQAARRREEIAKNFRQGRAWREKKAAEAANSDGSTGKAGA